MTIDATFWVSISFFIFIGVLIYLKVPQKINLSFGKKYKLYLINFFNLSSISLSDKPYSISKFGEITLGNLKEGFWKELSEKDKKYLEKISRK